MAHMGKGADMARGPGYGGAMQRPANPRAGDRVAVRIPPGGEARVRHIDNGVVVTTHDANYNQTGEVHAPSAGHVDMK